MYAGQVDCVFIDPPYNTGNEGWSYDDNVNSPMMQEWLRANPIGIEDGLRHDKWCAMMWPRLRLLHELLSSRGSIWITLDDNEMARARGLLDQIFGEANYLGVVVWEKADSPRMDADYFSTSHDYAIAYAKDKSQVIFKRLGLDDDEAPEHYNMEDDEGRSYYLKPLRAMGGQGETREARPNLYFPMRDPDGNDVYPRLQDGRDGAWRWSKAKVSTEVHRIEWVDGRNGWAPYYRIYADSSKGRPPETIFYNTDVGSSRTAKAQIKEVFGGAATFETPKPLGLLDRILEIATVEGSVVLDSFAGSGTTGHAVLARNAFDGGTRKFILVECESYADTLTAERIRRVIGGYEFEGSHRTELFSKRLTFTDLKRADRLLEQVASYENLQGHEFDSIEKKVKDGVLSVEGVKVIVERIEGLGGSFTYCDLGDAVDLDRLLTGESLPTFEQLGCLLFHMATNEAVDPAAMFVEEGHGYLGESTAFHVWLIYQPDLEFLKSRDAALTMAKAKALVEAKPGKRHLVFAPAKFVSQKLLDEAQVPVEFAPLPWALYRAERG